MWAFAIYSFAAAFLVHTSAKRPLDWVALGCPKATGSQPCSYQNPSSSSDMAVALFFQVEDTKGPAGFQCKTGGTVHCQGSWTLAEQGSVGSCFFLLKASDAFECSGSGQVNVIGAHGVKLTGKFLEPMSKELPCKGSLSRCSYKNGEGKDLWISLAFDAPSPEKHGLTCSVDTDETCHAIFKGKGDARSCAFLLPAGGIVECKVVAGSPNVTTAVMQPFTQQLTPVSVRKDATCPPETGSTNTTMCDCSYTNPGNTDMIVAMSAQNADGKFNNFHCYVHGVNVCAWGVNNGEQGAAGACYFILPAGASYSCQMQWGATAFPSVRTLSLSGASIFPASGAIAQVQVSNAHHIPSTRSEEDLRKLFQEFQDRHGFMEPSRFENFKRFVALADNHPTNLWIQDGGSFSSLAVLSIEEFEAMYRNCARTQALINPWSGITEVDIGNTPDSVDWREKGVVTPVKNQGQCGSCWSFSATGVLEGAWALAGHGLTSLSEQNLVSCNKDVNAGCNGGWPWRAIDYVHSHGIDTEASYPYESGTGQAPACAASSGRLADIKVFNHTFVEPDEDRMAAWVATNGPLSVSVEAMTQLWWPYHSGILRGCCNKEVDHAVLIVGFGEEQGQRYWIIKNSWGETWGEKGYLRLERGTNQCGITTQPTGSIVGGSPPSPPPSPPSPPTCPPDAQFTASAQGHECLWTNGTKGVIMPPSPSEYCDYLSQGYFGYSWDSSKGNYSCPKSAKRITNGASDYFCLWENGQRGMTIPKHAKGDCAHLSQGRIGVIIPDFPRDLVV